MSFFGEHIPISALLNFDVELQYFFKELRSLALKHDGLKQSFLEAQAQYKTSHGQKIKSKTSKFKSKSSKKKKVKSVNQNQDNHNQDNQIQDNQNQDNQNQGNQVKSENQNQEKTSKFKSKSSKRKKLKSVNQNQDSHNQDNQIQDNQNQDNQNQDNQNQDNQNQDNQNQDNQNQGNQVKSENQNQEKTSQSKSLMNALYIFRYGPCYTTAITNHLLRMIKINPFVFCDALWKRSVNICCIGKNSVFEIVAICKVFSLAQDMFWKCTRKSLQINVAIVDSKAQRIKVTSHLLQILLKTNHIFNTLKMTIQVQHVKVNLAKALKGPIVEILEKADLVTIVKLVSEIRVQSVTEQLVWEIANSMKINGVLFFLDTDMIQQCKIFQKCLEPLNDFQSLYGPINIEPFTLTIKSIRKCKELYRSKRQKNICLTRCIINSSAWIKTNSKIKEKETKSETGVKQTRESYRKKAMAAKKVWYAKVHKSQKSLEDFHRKIQDIFRKKKANSDDENYCLDYPIHDESLLFKNKCKNRRIFLDY